MENDKQDSQVKTPIIRNLLFIVLILLVIFVFTLFIIYKNTIVKTNGMGKNIEFEIQSGQSLNEISYNLKQLGVIRSTIIFKTYLKLNKIDTNIQAGNYVIPGGISIKELAVILQHGLDDTALRYI